MDISRKLFLFLTLLCLWCCHKNETIKVQGVIKGCPDTDIFLYNGQTRLDSSFVRNGQFEFGERPVHSARINLYIRNDHFWSPIIIYPEPGVTKLEIDFEKSTQLAPVFKVLNNSNHAVFDILVDSLRTKMYIEYSKEADIKVDMAIRLLNQNKNKAMNEDFCFMLAQFLDPLQTGKSTFNKLKNYCQMVNDSKSLRVINEKMRIKEKLSQQKTMQ